MITFIPVGGLANRMRSINAVASLANEFNQEPLRIFWFKDQGLNCLFKDLFEPITIRNIQLKEASTIDQIIFDRPRTKNLHLPRIFQKVLFDSCIYEQDSRDVCFDYLSWKQHTPRAYIASFTQFYPSKYPMKELFTPLPSIKKEIEAACTPFTSHTIGIHIRRSDHTAAIHKSPTEAFIMQMEKELEQHESVSFFIASDSEEDKQKLKKRFGNRIITLNHPTQRNSSEGIKNAVIDMYTLAGTQKIFGSFGSSYSEIAAQIGNCKLITITQ